MGYLLGLAFVLAAPALASAQLFPNLPIRRERVPCDQENPQFRHVRQEYWGYYPTCWRKFPPGWGCPSPEAPDWEAEKKRQKVDLAAPAEAGTGRRPKASEDDARPNRPQGDLPPLPNGGGLFNDELKPGMPNPDGANPPGNGGAARSGGVKPADAPLGSTDGSPTASVPRRGRGFISGLVSNPRR